LDGQSLGLITYSQGNEMKLTSARKVIEVLGGIDAVAQMTGRSYKTVSKWQTQFESFPASTLVIMTRALAQLGHTAPHALWRQE
jgi:hypothetical protein